MKLLTVQSERAPDGKEPHVQNRKRDTDVQNRLLDSVGEGEGGIF